MKKAIVILLLVACASTVWAQAPQDVPKDHWAYEAVKELVDKGYMVGYPDGSFMGNRTLTRYEFATVVKRILDDVSAKIEAAKATQPATGPQQSNQPIVAPSPITGEDLANLQKLIDEFKPELAVIGARIDKIEQSIDQIKPTMDTLNAIITDPEGAFETMKSDVSGLKKVTVSGWMQDRYNAFSGDLNSATAAKPPSNFEVRRSRIKVTGKPTANTTAVIQLDAGQNYQGNSAPSLSLKDAFIEYDFKGSPSLGPGMLFGQMTTSDPTRSPAGTESVWAYTHVPNGIDWPAEQLADHVDRVQQSIERHAPGFSAGIVGRHVQTPADLQAADANLMGGATNGGTARIHQQLFFRPTPGTGRAETPIPGLFLASASAHPGGGVHGACGWNAALAALRAQGRAGGRSSDGFLQRNACAWGQLQGAEERDESREGFVRVWRNQCAGECRRAKVRERSGRSWGRRRQR